VTAKRETSARAAARRHRVRRSVSVRTRILVAILAITAVGLASSGAASYLVQRERALATVDAQLSRSVPELRAIAAGQASGQPPASVRAVLRAAMGQLVPSANESVLGFIDYVPAFVPGGTLPFHIESDPALVKRIVSEASATNVVMGTSKSSAGTLRYVIVPVTVAGDSQLGLFVAAFDLDAVLGDVAQSFQSYLIVALIALALIGLVAWFVAGRLLRPIGLLRDAASANSGADLSARIPVSGHDDVSELAVAINGMFERLENAFNSQRQLIDDVRHELKTPITIIRGNLELLDPGNAADIEATRSIALDELERMNGLVSELSLLAESDAPDFVELAPVDVADLAAAVATKARALDPGREWPVAAGVEGTWLLDEGRITQAWLQLADNAVKYSTSGAPIAIGSEIAEHAGGGRWLHLWVRDGGPGIPEHARTRIFERFGRLESSRGAEGSGLGLAIVLAIAEAHAGTVVLSSEPGHGSTFTIQLPPHLPPGRPVVTPASDRERL
jgi:two-component system OmpR family sensor kinase